MQDKTSLKVQVQVDEKFFSTHIPLTGFVLATRPWTIKLRDST